MTEPSRESTWVVKEPLLREIAAWAVRFVRHPWTGLAIGLLVTAAGAYDLLVSLPEELKEGSPQDLAGEAMVAFWGALLFMDAVKDVLSGVLRLDDAVERLDDEGALASFLRKADRIRMTWWWNLGLAVLYTGCGFLEMLEAVREPEEGFPIWFVGLLIMGVWSCLRVLGEFGHVLKSMRKLEAGSGRPHPRLEALRAWLDRPAVGVTLCCLVIAVGSADLLFMQKGGSSTGGQHGMMLAVFFRLVRGAKVFGRAGFALEDGRA
ncbi:MAG: hypothetical protein HY924_06325 [Elusimicrobia bacterium]|nr:hypothetical protein [Elusimicrobiota bacterium]